MGYMLFVADENGKEATNGRRGANLPEPKLPGQDTADKIKEKARRTKDWVKDSAEEVKETVLHPAEAIKHAAGHATNTKQSPPSAASKGPSYSPQQDDDIAQSDARKAGKQHKASSILRNAKETLTSPFAGRRRRQEEADRDEEDDTDDSEDYQDVSSGRYSNRRNEEPTAAAAGTRRQQGHDVAPSVPKFPRPFIVQCEGYFRTKENEGRAGQRLPWPRSDRKNWPSKAHKNEWMEKLAAIQDATHVVSYRGMSWSRLEDGTLLGNKEYVSEDLNQEGQAICWTQDLLDHYVGKYDVVPSEEFYNWVMDYEL